MTGIITSSPAESLTFVAATGGDGIVIEFRYEDENILLTQKPMAEHYCVAIPTIIGHLKTFYANGKPYNTEDYNLQAFVAAGFKVENPTAAQFRKWAGRIVKDYTIQDQLFVSDFDRFFQLENTTAELAGSVEGANK